MTLPRRACCRACLIRWARPGTGSASISRCSPPMPTQIELCLFDPSGRREIARIDAAGMHRRGLARLSAERAARPALRLSRARSLRAAERPSLQSAQAAARSLCAAARRRAALVRRAVRLPRELAARRSVLRPPRQRARHARRPSSPTTPSTGATTGRPTCRGPTRSSTRRMCAASRCCTTDVRAARARHLRGARRSATSSTICAGSASPRSSCCRSTPSCRTATCVQKGLRNYWGYNTLGFFATEPRYLSSGSAERDAGRGAPPACRRHRGDSRRRLQPHRRRQRARPDAVVPRPRQCELLPARSRTTAAIASTTPAPATR